MTIENDEINPIFSIMHKKRADDIISRFPILRTVDKFEFNLLWQYMELSPQRFYSKEAYQLFLDKLIELDANDKQNLLNYLSESAESINNAYRHMSEICALDWHDEDLRREDDYQLLTLIDKEINPAYLRLTEGVLRPLVGIVAYFSRLSRGKKTEGLDMYNIAQEVRRTEFSCIVQSFDNLIRNGIAHGSVKYVENSIIYRDKQGDQKVLEDSKFIRNFDDLLDVCNGLLLAFSIFLFTRNDDRYKLPTNLLVEELAWETETPYWKVVGCLPSTRTDSSQLIIYSSANTFDEWKVYLSLFHTAILAEKYAPGFDRYFFSIRSKKSLPGFSAFNGKKLAEYRMRNCSLEQYTDALEDGTLFYSPRLRLPKIVKRAETLWLAFRVQKGIAVANFRKEFGMARISIRNSQIHRNSLWGILNAHAFIEAEELNKETIRKNCRKIVRHALKCGKSKMSKLNILRRCPLGFCRISVFRNDYRSRRLSNIGLVDDLICTIQVQRTRRVKAPDIYRSTIEDFGQYRIAWNRRWLEATQQNEDED